MKFARLLRTTAEDLPELQCLFHIYKHLKKQLKQLPARSDGKLSGADPQQPQAGRDGEEAGGDAGNGIVSGNPEPGEEARFTAVLTDHLQRLNDRFLEREETCVIQLERLEAEVAQCNIAARAAVADTAAGRNGGDGANGQSSPMGPSPALKAVTEQRAQLYKRFVNFHGEVLLLVHWSVLAYTATVKILKKHHKRTGLLLRAPQLADLLSQPFCSSELMTGLARKAEACIQRLAEQLASSATSGGGATTTTTDGNGATGGEAAALGTGASGGGGPQDTVEQVPPGGGADVAAAKAGAMKAAAVEAAGVDGSYGIADGSSPSCSQSLSELPLRLRASAWGPSGRAAEGDVEWAAAEAEAEAEAMNLDEQQHQRPRQEPNSEQQQTQRQRRRRESVAQRQQLQGLGWGQGEGEGAGGGGGGGGATAGVMGAGGDAGGGPGGGVMFLRNLARLSDNASAASLSGPNVLEQLVELQQYVDEYDRMDEDDPDGNDVGDEDEEGDEEEDSGAPAASQGLRAAAGAAAAAAAGRDRYRGGGPAAADEAVGGFGTAGPSILANGGLTGPCTIAGGGAAAAATGGERKRQPPLAAPQGAAAAAVPPGAEAGGGEGSGGANAVERVDPHPRQPLSHSRLQAGHQPASGPLAAGDQGEERGAAAAGSGPGSGSGSGSGSGQASAPAAPEPGAGSVEANVTAVAAATLPTPPPARLRADSGAAVATAAPQLPQSSTGSAGAAGAAGSVSVAISEAFAATRPQAAAANLLRRTQVALTMWEQLRANASTPSTVIDPAGGQQAGRSQGGGGGGGGGSNPRGKRRRLGEGEGAVDAAAGAAAAGEAAAGPHPAEYGEESVADDSGSNSD